MENGIDILVRQIEESVLSKSYFLALNAVLTVPDIAAAVESDDGKATGKKYIAWYDKWVLPRFGINCAEILRNRGIEYTIDIPNPFEGADCYSFRCKMLHQAIMAGDHPKYARILFVEPGVTPSKFHYNTSDEDGNLTIFIDLGMFCKEVVDGYRDWLDKVKEEENFIRNMEKTVHRHPNGLHPHIIGVSVIS